MDEQSNEMENSENTGDVDTSNDAGDENTSLTVDDYNRLLEEKLALEAKNKQLYARLNKPKEKESQPLQTASIPNSVIERLELKTEGYNDSEIEFIKQNGGRKSLENPLVKEAIESMRAKARADSAVVDLDSNKSDVEKQYTEGQLKNMPLEELEKLVPKA